MGPICASSVGVHHGNLLKSLYDYEHKQKIIKIKSDTPSITLSSSSSWFVVVGGGDILLLLLLVLVLVVVVVVVVVVVIVVVVVCCCFGYIRVGMTVGYTQ